MIVLRPCPFCGGPPVIFHGQRHEGTYVFCHECGAQGPVFDPIFESPGLEVKDRYARVTAARLWNASDQRHADLYSVELSTIDDATGERASARQGPAHE